MDLETKKEKKEEEQALQRKKILDEKIVQVKIITDTLSKINSRYDRILDPVARHIAALNMVCLTTDSLVTAFIAMNADLPEESRKLVEKVAEEQNERILAILDWIQSSK